jgi:uncharacterized delta-60 repeat protein
MSVSHGFRQWGLLVAAALFAGVNTTTANAGGGDVDATFGGGRVLTDFGGFGNGRVDQVNGVTVDAQGRVVAVGFSRSSDPALGTVVAVARYNGNGTLDTTFGSNGKVTSGFGFPIGANTQANAVAIDRTGGIVVAGWTDGIGNLCTDPPCSANERFLVARYNSDGSLDTAFAENGVATVSHGDLDRAEAIGIDSAGRIVVAGSSVTVFSDEGASFEVLRLMPDGFEDASFGQNGLVLTPLGDGALAHSLVIDAQDRIIVAGGAVEEGGFLEEDSASFALVRYDVEGHLDSTFDGDGIVFTDVSGARAQGVAIDQQGRIVAAGTAASNLALVRYDDDGSVDTGFGGSGEIIVHSLNVANAIVIDGFGRIVVAGPSGDTGLQGLVRFNPDGSIDPSFGNGRVTTALPGDGAGFLALALDDVGRLVAAGTSYNLGTDSLDFTLLRYLSDDFGFSTVPAVSMAVDTSLALTLTLFSQSRFDSAVSLFVSGQPIDVTASVSPMRVTPRPGVSATATLSIALGPTVTPGAFGLTVMGSSPAVDHSTPVSVIVYATSASIANVVDTMQAAGCIDAGIGGAMASTLRAMQADIDAARFAVARNTREALLNQIHAQSGKQIAASCTIGAVIVNPVDVLTTDLQLVQGL